MAIAGVGIIVTGAGATGTGAAGIIVTGGKASNSVTSLPSFLLEYVTAAACVTGETVQKAGILALLVLLDPHIAQQKTPLESGVLR